jgi:hypothetical protein
MVASQDEKVFGVLDLVGEKQHHRLDRIFTPVNVVSQKQIIGIGRISSSLENPQKVGKLSM